MDTQKMKNRLILKNLDEDDRKALIGGSITLSSLLMGSGLYHFFGRSESERKEESNSEAEIDGLTDLPTEELPEDFSFENEDMIVVETNMDVTHSDHNISFNEAFAQARSAQGAGGFFEWRGGTYNTYYKEEMENLGDTQSQEYFQQIDNSIVENSYQQVSHQDLMTSAASQSSSIEEVASLGSLDTNTDGIIDSGAISIEESGIDISLDKAIDLSQESEILASAETNSDELIESFESTNSTTNYQGADIIESQPLADQSISFEDDGSIAGVMESLDADDDGIIDFGAQEIGGIANAETSVSGIMESLDVNDDGIIDFGAQDIVTSNHQMADGVMESLDDDNDGIIDFGASDINGGFATLESVNESVINTEGIMENLDNDDDGIIDFGASDLNDGGIASED